MKGGQLVVGRIILNKVTKTKTIQVQVDHDSIVCVSFTLSGILPVSSLTPAINFNVDSRQSLCYMLHGTKDKNT